MSSCHVFIVISVSSPAIICGVYGGECGGGYILLQPHQNLHKPPKSDFQVTLCSRTPSIFSSLSRLLRADIGLPVFRSSFKAVVVVSVFVLLPEYQQGLCQNIKYLQINTLQNPRNFARHDMFDSEQLQCSNPNISVQSRAGMGVL